MKKLLGVALGILTAIGGFVDIGDLVTSAQVGSRFGLSLALVTVLGVIGIGIFSEMAGRVVAVSGRPAFDIIRERLGSRLGLLNLAGSVLVTLLTFLAEIGGMALALELASGVHYLLWMPVFAVLVWIVLWRAKFQVLENAFGLLGLALLVFAVALWQLGPDWSELAGQVVSFAVPEKESLATTAYYVVALFGAAMTPYAVLFFSSGGVEEKWTAKDLGTMRLNVWLGFPLGGLLSLSIAACAAVVLRPLDMRVEHLGQVGMPVVTALGTIGVVIALVGFFAATFGAACETGLSVGYSVAQYFGWRWGKSPRPREAARFHTVILFACLLAPVALLTTIDPITVTEFSVVFSAVAIPLTYFPILVVANDPGYMGEHANGRVANTLGSIYLVLVTIAAVAALPLMILTQMGTR